MEGLEKKKQFQGHKLGISIATESLRRVWCVVELIQQIENCVLHQVTATHPN